MGKLLFIFLFTVSSIAIAGEGRRIVTINKILSFSGARPAQTASQNVIRVYVNQAEWTGAPSCRNDAADLQASDQHTLSLLMMAWATGKEIEIGVEENLKPIDTVCQISFIIIK